MQRPRHAEALAEAIDALVVVGLHVDQLGPGCPGCQRTRLQRHLVISEDAQVRAVALGAVEHVGEVLDQSPSEGNVQHLHPAADPEHRHLPLRGGADQGHLHAVSARIGAVGLRCGLLAVGGRVDVGAAGQHQGVDAVERLVRRGHVVGRQQEGKAARVAHLVRVLAGEQRGGLVPDRPGGALDRRADPHDRPHSRSKPR